MIVIVRDESDPGGFPVDLEVGDVVYWRRPDWPDPRPYTLECVAFNEKHHLIVVQVRKTPEGRAIFDDSNKSRRVIVPRNIVGVQKKQGNDARLFADEKRAELEYARLRYGW